ALGDDARRRLSRGRRPRGTRLRDSRRPEVDLPGGHAPPGRPRPRRRGRGTHRRPGALADPRAGARTAMSVPLPREAPSIAPDPPRSGANVAALPVASVEPAPLLGARWRPTRRGVLVVAAGFVFAALPAVV